MTKWLTWLQGGVLLLMAGVLTTLLVALISKAHQPPAIDGIGLPEPSLRVLLHHHASSQRHWPQVRIRAQRDLVLLRPDQPQVSLKVPAQSQLIISPQGEDGISINQGHSRRQSSYHLALLACSIASGATRHA